MKAGLIALLLTTVLLVAVPAQANGLHGFDQPGSLTTIGEFDPAPSPGSIDWLDTSNIFDFQDSRSSDAVDAFFVAQSGAAFNNASFVGFGGGSFGSGGGDLWQNGTQRGSKTVLTPEPGSFALLLSGLLCLGFFVYRRKHWRQI